MDVVIEFYAWGPLDTLCENCPEQAHQIKKENRQYEDNSYA